MYLLRQMPSYHNLYINNIIILFRGIIKVGIIFHIILIKYDHCNNELMAPHIDLQEIKYANSNLF